MKTCWFCMRKHYLIRYTLAIIPINHRLTLFGVKHLHRHTTYLMHLWYVHFYFYGFTKFNHSGHVKWKEWRSNLMASQDEFKTWVASESFLIKTNWYHALTILIYKIWWKFQHSLFCYLSCWYFRGLFVPRNYLESNPRFIFIPVEIYNSLLIL